MNTQSDQPLRSVAERNTAGHGEIDARDVFSLRPSQTGHGAGNVLRQYERSVDEMRDRLLSADDPMTLRRSTVVHPFGTIKAWMGTTHFPMRRLKRVRTEMALNALACNIKRMVALVGLKRLMAAIPA